VLYNLLLSGVDKYKVAVNTEQRVCVCACVRVCVRVRVCVSLVNPPGSCYRRPIRITLLLKVTEVAVGRDDHSGERATGWQTGRRRRHRGSDVPARSAASRRVLMRPSTKTGPANYEHEHRVDDRTRRVCARECEQPCNNASSGDMLCRSSLLGMARPSRASVCLNS